MADVEVAEQRDVMTRMGHASTRAALIYQHGDRDRERDIAAGLSAVIEAARAPTSDENGHAAGTDPIRAPRRTPDATSGEPCDLVRRCWHPQRDSNPCRHLERVVS
jgi:hypothetical protein